MRVTAEAQAATRNRILQEATRLFTTEGWERTTTRRIAEASGIAAGTLFNYFKSKEALAEALMAEAIESGVAAGEFSAPLELSLEEDLFSFVWSGLKSLRPLRPFLPDAAETILSPLRQFSSSSAGDDLRVRHLEAAEYIMARHGVATPLPAVSLQLYWTLYLGVFGYWTRDESPNQEDTMALLDESLHLFAATLSRPKAPSTLEPKSEEP
jgi:AcrR family transcriptional regulator